MIRTGMLLLALTIIGSGAHAQKPAEHPYSTPQEVWDGFDPRKEPLDVEMKRRWVENGASYKEFYFTAETVEGQPVRVYAMYAEPVRSSNAERLPAILHIHGGGQTVSPEWLKFWTSRGYAVMSFNWGGRWENRAEYTKWGALKQGNHLDAIAGPVVKPSQHVSSWYHWALVSRRCLTWLEQQPGVDPNRIGIFGVSMGGTLVWSVAAMDDRVKAACAVYGNGWDSHNPDRYAPDPNANNPDVLLWRKTMQAESYAPMIKCPLLFLSATDDQHGRMDRADDILDRVLGPTWQSITPNQRHHIAPEQGRSLPMFMDMCLKGGKPLPNSPAVKLGPAKDGVPALTVSPASAGDVERVDVYYGLQTTNPMARHWRLVRTAQQGRTWRGSMPIIDEHQRLFAFAEVTYRSGLCLTSRLLTDLPSHLCQAEVTDQASLLIDDFSHGMDGWVRQLSYTDPCMEMTFLRMADGPGGVKGLSHIDYAGHFACATHKIGDPKWRGPAGSSLEFQVLSSKPNTLKVAVVENEFIPGMKTYAATATLKGSPDWQTFVLSPDQFKTDAGEPLSSWDVVCNLEITSDTWEGPPPVLSMFRWRTAVTR